MITKKAYSCQEKSFGLRGADFAGEQEDLGLYSDRLFPILFELRIKKRTLEDDSEKLPALAIDQVDSGKHQDSAGDLLHAQIFTKQRHGKKGCHHGLA